MEHLGHMKGYVGAHGAHAGVKWANGGMHRAHRGAKGTEKGIGAHRGSRGHVGAYMGHVCNRLEIM